MIAADDFLARMKKEYTALKARAEKLGYSPKRRKPYLEPTNIEWSQAFLPLAEERRERLSENLEIEELVEESGDQFQEALAYIAGFPPELRERVERRFWEGMVRVEELRESNRKRAEQMLARVR